MSIEKGSCRCCLLVGSFSDTWEEHYRLGEVEVYGDMINECFGVSLSPLNSSTTRDQICSDCITSLRDALTFKGQMLNSNRQLTEHIVIMNMQSDYDQIEYLESDSEESSNCHLSEIRSEPVDCEETYKEVEYLEASSNSESEEVNVELPKVSKNNGPTLRYTEEQLKVCLEAVKGGHLNQVQAAETFNIPRQTICFRLKQETGDKYKEVVSGWKKTQLKIFREEERRKHRLLEKASRLYECLKSIKEGCISMSKASLKYKISLNSIKKALQEEFGANYDEKIMNIQKNYVNNKRKHEERKPRNCGAAKIPRPSQFTLMQAVTAVKDKKMSVLAASAYYNIQYKLLLKIILQDIDVFNTDTDEIFQKKILNNYTESDLAKCVEIVRKGGMTQKRASEVYHIPESVISEKVLKYIGDEFTKQDCLSVVLHYTNAIPFKVTKNEFKCAYCSITTNNTEELRLHTQLDHKNVKAYKMDKEDVIRLDILDLKCVVCDEYIEQWHDLLPHFEGHKIKIINSDRIIPYTLYYEAFICALCDEIYPKFRVLDMHMNEHFVNYVCQDCGQPFFNLNRLRRHKLYCNDCKYICDVCDKEFSVKYHLRVHIDDHMRVLKSSCKYCKGSFGSPCERYMHIKKMHSHRLFKYSCKLCKKSFGWKPFYMSHYRMMHVRNSRYECTTCREKFFSQISLERHTKKHRVSMLAL